MSARVSISTPELRKRHVGALDGVRALAVLAVMGFHIGFPGLRELGSLGVDVFFVLSGFLITTLLLDERAREGSIHLGHFWARRLLRLMPAYWLYAGAMTGVMLGMESEHAHASEGWSVGLYVASLWLYFNNLAPVVGMWEDQRLVIHLWSLAVEEQFYLVWPLALWLLRTRRSVVIGAGVLCLATVLCMQFGYPGRIERWPHTRGFSILVGCLVAALTHPLASGASHGALEWIRSGVARRGAFLGACLVFAAGSWFVKHEGMEEKFAVRTVVPAFAPLVGVLCAALWYGTPDALSRALSFRPLAYLGTISYGLYLYHMLAQHIVWKWTHVHVPGGKSVQFGVKTLAFLAISIAIAAASYHFLEQPIGKLKKHFRNKPPVRAATDASARLQGGRDQPTSFPRASAS
jgi:peptidoglycan/LPS O-acetylase OafA/YrhL